MPAAPPATLPTAAPACGPPGDSPARPRCTAESRGSHPGGPAPAGAAIGGPTRPAAAGTPRRRGGSTPSRRASPAPCTSSPTNCSNGSPPKLRHERLGVIQRPPLAGVAQRSRVVGLHPATTPAADHQARQQRHRRPRRPRRRAVPPVVRQAAEIALILIKRYVSGMIVRQEHGAVLGRALPCDRCRAAAARRGSGSTGRRPQV